MCHVCVMLAGSDPAMSLPGVSPCYLYRNIWLIDWLQIINKTFNISTQCWWYRSIVTFQEWRRQFCHVTFSNINVLPMPLLTPRQRSPDQSEGKNWLIDQWEASVMRASWLRGRVGDSCGEAEGRANQSVHTLTSPHTTALWLVTEPQLWPLIGHNLHLSPPGCGKSGDSLVTVVRSDSHDHADWEISCSSDSVMIVLSMVVTMWEIKKHTTWGILLHWHSLWESI